MDLLESHGFADDYKTKDVIESFKLKPYQLSEDKDPLNNNRNVFVKENEKPMLFSPGNNKVSVAQNVDNGLRFGLNSTLDDAAETYPIGPKTSDMGREINQLAAEATFSHWSWPPYVLVLSALVVVLSHALHCALVVLATALPYLRKLSTFLWNWSEERLQTIMTAHFVERSLTLLLCVATFVACLVFYLAYAAYALLLWMVQPLWTRSDPPIDNDYSFNKIASEGTDIKKMKMERSMEKSISNYQG